VLIEKLKSKSATIGIIGLGYVGIPLLLRYSEVGYKLLGFDIDKEKINKLKAGKSYIDHIPSHKIQEAIDMGAEVTDDFSRASDADALIICVPTPLNKYREPDLSYINQTVDSIVPFLRKGQVISLESTTYPGTTEEEVLPKIASAGFEVGTEIFLVYSPEREDPGNPEFTTKSIPKVCGGYTEKCKQVGIALYENVVNQVVPVSSLRAAELTKLLENIHRAVNIGLVNEMKILADRMDIDIHEVIRAAATKPFGFVPYYPGPGLGGHCIPIDPFYLTWKAREYGLHTRFIELAGEINSLMPDFVVSKIVSGLNRNAKPVLGSNILILGVSYKKNIGDMRESPSVVIIERLLDMGAIVEYSDSHVPFLPAMRNQQLNHQSIALDEAALSSFDCVLIATDHDDFDYQMISDHAQLIVDTRGRFLDPSHNVIKS